MKKLDKILGSALAKKGLAGLATSAEICFYAEKWGKIPFSVISFSRGILKVSVNSAAQSSELSIMQEDLVDFLNKKVGRTIVKNVRILIYK